MADMKQIHDFAVKWCDKFRDQNINYIDLVDHFMADDCAALGFEMDCGHAFYEKYGQAASNYEALDKIIDDVTDIPLLGSAIYSQWRYFNHWAYDAAEILDSQNRAWFILALSRLALLSGENPFLFQGTLKKMRIVSNNICYGPMPNPDEEVEQHLTIDDEGRVWFSGYSFDHGGENYEKARSKNFKIEKTDTDRLLGAIAAYFGNEYDEIFATDIGNWVMELTNTEGTVYKFRGSLCADFDYEGTDLSDLVRDIVDMDDLYVFDGKKKRRKSEYIFCSVTFDEGYKSYYYLTDDDSIEVGDFVLVPVGKENHETVVEVVNIEYFSEENVPLPVEKTKRIIRKCADEDFDLPQSE